MNNVDVLVLDDEPDLCFLMYSMLKYSGYKVEKTIDPGLVHLLLDKHHPKLLLMDMMLSGVDGKAICAGLRSKPVYKDQKILMISAHPNAHEDCMEAGADAFLAKPFDMDEFLKVINELVVSA